MLLAGTVVAGPTTVVPDGAVVTEGERIAAVGERADLVERYPDHERRTFDIVMPGLVAGHVHSVQSLGRGLADDAPLLEWLSDAVLPMEAALNADGMRAAAELGYLELLASGTTTVVDHLSVHHADQAFEAAADLGVRARLGKVLMDDAGDLTPPALVEDADAALSESEALIERYHGAADDRLRYAVTPRFALSCTEDCLRGARELADRHDGVTLHTHAAETREEVAALREETGQRTIHYLDEVGLTGDDVVLAHCVHCDDAERALLSETGTHVCHCPSSNMKLASGVAPVVDYRERGVGVAVGSDGPPCNNALDPYTEMRQAALLARVDALDATALAAADVLEMATLSGALAAGFKRVGALREGWRADVVGVDTGAARATPTHDPRSHLVFTAHGDDVRFTMVDGRVVYEDGDLRAASVDAAAVRERATEEAARL